MLVRRAASRIRRGIAGSGGRGWVRSCVGGLVAIVLLAYAAFGDPPDALSVPAFRAGILTAGAVSLWASGVFPIGTTAAGFLLAALLLGFEPKLVLSGVSSGPFWIVVGGIFIGISVHHTGLGRRLAHRVAPAMGGTYVKVLAGTAAAALLFAFLMPSAMGRVLLLTPIVLALADRFGFAAGTRGRTGMVVVATTAGFMPAGAILTALVPNLVLAGAAENLYEWRIQYAAYLWTHFPVMGLLRAAMIVLVAAWLFRDEPRPPARRSGSDELDGAQRHLSAVLAITLLIWLTDTWHGISPAWAAVGVAVYILARGRTLVPAGEWPRRVDYHSILYTAAVLGLGAMLTSTGLSEDVGAWLSRRLPLEPGADVANTFWMTTLAAALGLVVTNPGVPAVLSPLANQFAASTGLPVEAVLMSQVAGFSNVILPYQAAPVLVGMAMGGVGLRDAARMLACTSVVTLGLLVPLQCFWWKWLGIL